MLLNAVIDLEVRCADSILCVIKFIFISYIFGFNFILYKPKWFANASLVDNLDHGHQLGYIVRSLSLVGVFIMAKMCDISGKKKSVKNKVSHSKRRTKSVQEANLQTRAFIDPVTGKKLRLRVSTKMIKTITQKGLHAVLRKFNKTDLIPS